MKTPKQNPAARGASPSTAGLERALRKMFFAGETWGVTWSTWFVPSSKDTEETVREAIKKAKLALRSNVELTGAAPLYRAASSDRRERG